MEQAPKVEGTSSGTSALDDGFGGALNILDCLQDRPVADGKVVPEKCVKAPVRECIWCEAKEGDHSVPVCSGPDGRGHHFRETPGVTPNAELCGGEAVRTNAGLAGREDAK